MARSVANSFTPPRPLALPVVVPGKAAIPPLFAVAVAFLSGMTDVKIADIQGVEVVMVGGLALALLQPQRLAHLPASRLLDSLKFKFLWMLLFMLVGSVLSLRLTFYPPHGIGVLKQPPFASFIRVVQVILSVLSLFVAALAARSRPEIFRKLLTAYVWCALLGSAWGVVSMAAYFAGVTLPGVGVQDTIRIRGFFVEGGPFGVYLVGAIIVQVIRGHFLRYISPFSFYAGLALLLVALIGAQSKASALLVCFVAIPYMIRVGKLRLMLVLLVLALPVLFASNLVSGVNGYYENAINFNEAASQRPDDWNLVLGRVAAIILLPRIVAAHPILGIGVGNYSLVRNDPIFLQGMPRVEAWDLHGLGLLGYCAELGIPLTLYVMWIYAAPIVEAWRTRPWIVLLGSYPLAAAVFGVQLNFAYPWIIMGMTIAAITIDADYRRIVAVEPFATPERRERAS